MCFLIVGFGGRSNVSYATSVRYTNVKINAYCLTGICIDCEYTVYTMSHEYTTTTRRVTYKRQTVGAQTQLVEERANLMS